ncbi:Ankyrin repeat domain-containing protein 63 [Bagarius yarrelli]|uniref:Ankyrin repeat domain-containing protein 63 n=1 Tax=Bagarius yarrelli TaxID=175774 RepID=A0A556V9T4_BAGYA|nr:Ankyrin repeat domain-containing protein 63 [Bagarius yarrelli]
MLRPKDLCQGSGCKTFLEAMNSGKVHLARFVLDALDCRIINSKNESSRTPLMCAVCLQEQNTRSKFTQLLLEKGADVNSRDENGRTALSLACELGHLDSVKLLVQFNANPELTDTWGNSALTYAAYGGHSQVLTIAGRKGINNIEQTHEIKGGTQEAVSWPNRLPKQILEKFSKQVYSKNEEALPSLFQKQMWINDGKDLTRQHSQQHSPERTNLNGYQSLTRFPERRFTEKEQHVLFSSKQFQNTKEPGFVRKNNFVSELCQKVEHREMSENLPQWRKEKSFNLELQMGRKQSYQEKRRGQRGCTTHERSFSGAEQRNSDNCEKKKGTIKRGSVIKNERPNKLLIIRDEVPRERIRIRPPVFNRLGSRLLRRFTAPEFVGLVRDCHSSATLNKGKIARSETFPLSYTHKLVNSQPSVNSISAVRCEFEGSPEVSRA